MSIFSQIRTNVPKKIVWENQNFFALRDIYPKAKTHILIIPKTEVRTMPEMSLEMKGELLEAVSEFTSVHQIDAYQLMINVNAPYQEVFHVHAHILSEQELPS